MIRGTRIQALSWKDVEQVHPGSNRSIVTTGQNSQIDFENRKKRFDADHEQIDLFGYAISAKHQMYRYKKDGNIQIVDAKAHGLGYLYPPRTILRETLKMIGFSRLGVGCWRAKSHNRGRLRRGFPFRP